MYDLPTQFANQVKDVMKSLERRMDSHFQALENRVKVLSDECDNHRKAQVHWYESAGVQDVDGGVAKKSKLDDEVDDKAL